MSNQDAVITARPVINLDVSERGAFIVRTYAHLFGAIVLFTLIEVALFRSGAAETIANAMIGTSWLLVLGGFMIVSWFATRAAMTSRSLAAQYMALGAFVLAEALIFVPLLWLAFTYAPGAIQSAAVVTLAGFTALTAIAIWSRKDFSFMGSMLRWVGFGALALIATSLIFGWNLGTWFSVGMVVFAGAAILYDTSNVMRRYPEDRYVGAALQLFASVALMFWYVLRIFLGSRD
jgi:FtsH-binding integral membrane protein